MIIETSSQSVVPIDLAVLRDHCRVTDRENDGALLRSLNAAAEDLENRIGIYIRTTTATVYFRGQPEPYRIPVGPVQSVTSLEDSDGTAVSSAAWELDKTSGWWKIRSTTAGAWIASETYTLVFVCGYESLPAPLLIAVLELSALHFENREASTPVPMHAVPGSVWSIAQSYGPGKL